jgi:hypothetical protein
MVTRVVREGAGTDRIYSGAGAGGFPKGPRGKAGLGGAYAGKQATGAGTAAKGGVKLQQTKVGRGK